MTQPQLFSDAPPRHWDPVVSQQYVRGQASIYHGRAEDHYADWPAPVCIISDGPYGVDGFPGDAHTVESLVEWYEPHIEAWSRRSTPETTLWFWNAEFVSKRSRFPLSKSHIRCGGDKSRLLQGSGR